jgi:hypothetical protein
MVRAFSKILLISFVVFLVLAMAQEHRVFLGALGLSRSIQPEIDEGRQSAAEQTLRQYLALVRHLYESNGDRRFAERLPAAPAVIDELMSDIVYLRHNGRLQEPRLINLEITDLREVSASNFELKTLEYWTVRTFFLESGEPSDTARAQVISARYRVEDTRGTWRVAAWELLAHRQKADVTEDSES